MDPNCIANQTGLSGFDNEIVAAAAITQLIGGAAGLEIMRLKLEGHSIRGIAEIVGESRSKVARVLERAESVLGQVRDLAEQIQPGARTP